MTHNAASVSPSTGPTMTVPVHEEQLQVETHEVDTGRGVRISKRVTERPETVSRELWHEEIDVVRVPVNSIVAEPPQVRHEGDTMVVPVVEEVLVVEKRYRVKEEVHIKRRRQTEVHEATVPVKAEELTVERFDSSPSQPEKH